MKDLRLDRPIIGDGAACIYNLGGIVLYSEDVTEDKTDPNFLYFKAKRTAQLFPKAALDDNGGLKGYDCSVLVGFGTIFGAPTYLRVGKSAVIISDLNDKNLQAQIRSAISGLTIVAPGGKVPPRR